MFDISVSKIPAVAVVQCSGRITHGDTAPAFRDKIINLIGENYQNFLIDLTDVSHVDVAGIGS